MKTYSVEVRTYDCHPETCCHEEHFGWWIVEHKPFNGSSVHKISSWVGGFNSKKEAEQALALYVNSNKES